MAFFLESTFVGLMILGWDKLTKVQHLAVTFLTALGTNLSALWILVANAWMQNPVGSEFSAQTMRMEMTDFFQVIFNPVAQVKFVHTVAAGYVTASVFVIGISAFYLLKGRDLAFAKRSFAVASAFGVAAALSVIVLGDESGYELGDVQKVKLAAIEAMYETEPAPAPFTIIGLPNDETKTTDFALKLPWVGGLIMTRSVDKEVAGIEDLIAQHEVRVRSGMIAYENLVKLRAGDQSPEVVSVFDEHKADLGYGLLLKRYVEDPSTATDEQIAKAAEDSIPSVPLLFWGFRIMVGIAFFLLVLFLMSAWHLARGTIMKQRWLLRTLLWSIPLPWIAAELGWFTAEYGRQPWAIGEVLPTFMATSALTVADLIFSMAGYLIFYTLLLIIEMFLMFKFARLGPSSLHTGRYHFERDGAAAQPAE